MRCSILLLALSSAIALAGQQRVLHFTKTSGFDHNTRAVSFAMFQSIAVELGVQVDDDATGATFSDPSALALYDVIVFANTSGNAILDAPQRANFEGFIANGGRVLGIHAASDTYRHSTANGNNTGTWDFYPELIGASVQENPNHVSGLPLYTMEHIGLHASTANLPDPWDKNEEYYYWLNGYYGTDNAEVLRVEETLGPNGQVNDYDAPRPMSWYRELPEGGRVFYTALGHATTNYTDDLLFRQHVKDALTWLLEGATSIVRSRSQEVQLFPNPASTSITLKGVPIGSVIRIIDPVGREILSLRTDRSAMSADLSALPNGSYTLVSDQGGRLHFCVIR